MGQQAFIDILAREPHRKFTGKELRIILNVNQSHTTRVSKPLIKYKEIIYLPPSKGVRSGRYCLKC